MLGIYPSNCLCKELYIRVFILALYFKVKKYKECLFNNMKMVEYVQQNLSIKNALALNQLA